MINGFALEKREWRAKRRLVRIKHPHQLQRMFLLEHLLTQGHCLPGFKEGPIPWEACLQLPSATVTDLKTCIDLRQSISE